MRDAGVALGLAPHVSDLLVRQTVKGAGALLSQSHEEAHTLSPAGDLSGGTTEAALKIMEKAKMRAIISKGAQARGGKVP